MKRKGPNIEKTTNIKKNKSQKPCAQDIEAAVTDTKKTVALKSQNVKKNSKSFPKNNKSFKGKELKSKLEKGHGVKDGAGGAGGEKPKWAEIKQQKRQLRQARRQQKLSPDLFQAGHKAKLLAAQILRKKSGGGGGGEEARLAACRELHALLRTHYAAVALSHDVSRAVQTVVKCGGREVAGEVWAELAPLTAALAASPYGRHVLRALLKHGGAEVAAGACGALRGRVCKLAARAHVAPLLDALWAAAPPAAARALLAELYGPLAASTPAPAAPAAADTGCERVPPLSAAWAGPGGAAVRAGVLGGVRAQLLHMARKGAHGTQLFAALADQYLAAEADGVAGGGGDGGSEAEGEAGAGAQSQHDEQAGELRAQLAAAAGALACVSARGAAAACTLVALATNKEKKAIVRALRGAGGAAGGVAALAAHRHAHALLAALLVCADDTVALARGLLAPLLAGEEVLRATCAAPHARLVLWTALQPLCTHATPPALAERLRALRALAERRHARKERARREAELRAHAAPPLVAHVAQDPGYWLDEPPRLLLALAALEAGGACGAGVQAATEALVRAVCAGRGGGVDAGPVHAALRALAAADRARATAHLPRALHDHLTPSTIEEWLRTNRGCFALVRALECCAPLELPNPPAPPAHSEGGAAEASEAGAMLRRALRDAGAVELLRANAAPGARLLHALLDGGDH